MVRSFWFAGLFLLLTIIAAIGGDQATRAAPATQPASMNAAASVVADIQTFRKHVEPFLKQHCAACHGIEKPKADLRLDQLRPDFVNKPHSEIWVEVANRLNLGEMPPRDRPRPDAAELAIVTRWVASELRVVAARAQSTGGRALLRRLNRYEYSNTVRDLLDVTFMPGEGPQDLLPPDGKVAGFDKLGKALLLDASLMDAYFRAAELVADRAIMARPPRVPTHTSRFEFEHTVHNPAIAYLCDRRSSIVTSDGLILMSMYARTDFRLQHPYNGAQVPVRGLYKVRIRAAADPGERGEPVYFDVTRGAEGVVAKVKVDAPMDQPRVYEFTRAFDPRIQADLMIQMINGTRFSETDSEAHLVQQAIDKAGESGRFNEAGGIQARARAAGLFDTYQRERPNPKTIDPNRLPKLYLDYIELEGPLQGPWPPKSMQTIFFDGTRDSRKIIDYAREIFQRLLPRAYRRPVSGDEVKRVVDVVGKEMQRGESFEEAVKAGLIVVLCSPSFLHLVEPDDANETAGRKLNDFELASRLSYFIWSSMPDAELTRRAAKGQLRAPGILQAQVDRMLADPKAESLIESFAAQWLKVDEFDRFKPDPQIYRAFYSNENAGLANDMKAEPLCVFRELLKNNQSVLNFLSSDWTMANERLARFYGIGNVKGEEFRRVTLPPGSVRGGLITMAGVHLCGSDGNRTKPVSRGKYILDVLFNDPPDPPPPNAGEVQPNTAGKNLSIRERLAEHRRNDACVNCHQRIDPYGLALENFNAIGLWRDVQDGERESWGRSAPAVDPSGALPNGRAFRNIHEFKQALAEQSDRFLTALAEKMLIYALGRTLEPSDRAAVDRLVNATKANGASLRSLIKALVESEAFQHK